MKIKSLEIVCQSLDLSIAWQAIDKSSDWQAIEFPIESEISVWIPNSIGNSNDWIPEVQIQSEIQSLDFPIELGIHKLLWTFRKQINTF